VYFCYTVSLSVRIGFRHVFLHAIRYYVQGRECGNMTVKSYPIVLCLVGFVSILVAYCCMIIDKLFKIISCAIHTAVLL